MSGSRLSDLGLSASYHVLVIGDELGGLMYAALAARAGYRVGVLGHGARSNAYRHQGHTFLRRPERFYGFSTSPIVSAVFRELNLGMEMRNRPRPVDPMLQLVTPDHRIDVLRWPERYKRELERELGTEEAQALLDFEAFAADWTSRSNQVLEAHDSLPPVGFRAQQRYRRAVSSCKALFDGSGDGLDPLSTRRVGSTARGLVDGVLEHLVTVRPQPLPPLARVRLWTHVRAGIHRMPGGLDGMKELFISKLKDQCGDYRRDAVVDEIVVRRGRASAVVLGGRGERLGCELLVANTDPRRFAHLIPPDSRNERFHAQLAEREPAAWRITFNVAVDPRVIPMGMGPELLLMDDEGAGLWVSRPATTEHVEGRPGPGVMVCTTLQPARGIAPGPPILERSLATALRRLRRVIPWFDEHVRAVHAPALIQQSTLAPLSVDVSELTPVMDQALPMTAGIGALSTETPYRNVLLGGDALAGGLGFEGACLGAIQTLDTTRRLLKLKVLRPGISARRITNN